MQLKVYGTVQGVGFRPFVYKLARDLGISGYVRNNGSNVEIVLSKSYKKFLKEFKANLPPLAQVERIEEANGTITRELLRKNKIKKGDFKILYSTDGTRESAIPPDTALCDDCLDELFNNKNRRHLYPFINCTDCGARFSVISNMPYDREKTAMAPFKLCEKCDHEFTNPADRRMHAQTISCSSDGPEFSLYLKGNIQIPTDTPIWDFAHELDTGAIGIMKSWGGMHIVSRLDKINQLRYWYKRPEKPFAVMVRDLETANKYGVLNENTKKLLSSPERPIVLVPKRRTPEVGKLLERIAPGLGTIGLYLPYSPIQYLLFNHLEQDALIMTSANPQGEPLIINNEKAFELDLDVYLIHNRDIINRVDDSLVIPHKRRFYFIRKSRGFVPVPIEIDYNNIILAVGAERNVCAAVSKNGKLYTSQYVGNTYYYNTLEFLKESVEHLIRLLGITEVDAVALDLHPQYPTRRLASELADKFNVNTLEIQHHWAHAASLLLDTNVHEPIIALTLDGAGYGPDGTIWGGEILYSYFDRYKHLGSLERLPLIGGDMAVHHPKRLVFGIYEQLGLNSDELDYFSPNEAEVYRNIIKTSPQASSLGRVLDSISCYLGISTERTYDGEPAMKLERYLAVGRPKFEFKTKIEGSSTADNTRLIKTLPLFKQLFEHVGNRDPIELSMSEKANLSHSFVRELIRNMMVVALEGANKMESGFIGITGGVTYNIPIVEMIRSEFKKALDTGDYDEDLSFLLHQRLPNGDGGISAGQNAVAGHMLAAEKH